MHKINFLSSIKSKKKNVKNRYLKKTRRHIEISRNYGKLYFDGPREYGYGGYCDDGRWFEVAKKIIKKYKLKKNDKFLDIGCAKGFLVNEMIKLGIDAYGIDISRYAIENSPIKTFGRIHLGCASSLPFPDNSFEAVTSFNTLHNLTKKNCIKAIKEIIRISKKNMFIQVDSYTNSNELKKMKQWILTAKFYTSEKNWLKLMKNSGYNGDYFWTLIK